MKNQKSFFTALFLCAIQFANAQNDADALRYSMLNYGSTARSLGMGNSFGALGADFSTLAINPAGLAMYHHSEFTLSPLFSNRTTESSFLGNTSTENNFKFAFGNFGTVFAGESKNAGSRWKGWGFGIGYNKLNDFSSRNTEEGNNSGNSLVDSYLEHLEGVAPADIQSFFPNDINLAWNTYLIDTTTIGGQLYYFNNSVPFGGALQRRTVETSGGQGEWDFSFGANYDNKLYLGITLGLSSLHYQEKFTWEETDNKDTIPFFKSFNYSYNLKTTGNGFNVKFGAIYKPNDIVRIGVAIHTPTYFTLTDEFHADINSDLESSGQYSDAGPVNLPYSYDLNTPFRAIGSVGLVFNKQVAINVDYEFLDYSQSRMYNSADQTYFNDVNDGIRAKYAGSNNLRIGGEYCFNNLRFRLGGQYSSSPFKKELRGSTETDQSRYGFSTGFGIKEEHYFIDFGYAYTRVGSFLRPYTLNDQVVPGIIFKQQDHRLLITAASPFKFINRFQYAVIFALSFGIFVLPKQFLK